jgi:serine O-acetyltransferase
VDEAATAAAEDLTAIAERDPAAGGSWRLVLDTYSSYQAVCGYRVANAVLHGDAVAAADLATRSLARRISEDAKARTGVEIHPAARIGRRFVLDHATGTVIGETAELGDDCYILQGVILGATGIAANPTGKRHPTIGSRVEIGAFARLLGPITIGDNCMIGPSAVVVTDLPAGSCLRLVNQCQVKSPHTGLEVFGVIPRPEGWIEIHGEDLAEADVTATDSSDRELVNLPVRVIERTQHRLTCHIRPGSLRPEDEPVLRLTNAAGERILLTQLGLVWRVLRRTARVSA